MKFIYILLCCVVLISCKQNSSEILEVDPVLEEIINESSVEESNTSTNFKLLQGTWVNIDAPLSSLIFEENKVINHYGGVDSKKNIQFSMSDSCKNMDAAISREADKYIRTTGDAEECYYIVQLDQENLILGFWGVETALRFKRQ